MKKTPIQDRRNFVGFLEEVAVMVNSGLIKKEVAHYMFGCYVLLTDRCDELWDGRVTGRAKVLERVPSFCCGYESAKRN